MGAGFTGCLSVKCIFLFCGTLGILTAISCLLQVAWGHTAGENSLLGMKVNSPSQGWKEVWDSVSVTESWGPVDSGSHRSAGRVLAGPCKLPHLGELVSRAPSEQAAPG